MNDNESHRSQGTKRQDGQIAKFARRCPHKSQLCAHRSNTLDHAPPVIVFDYQTSRHGRHARTFLGAWRGSLCVDDYAGYDKLFKTDEDRAIPCTEDGCMAHARRKFFDLHAANGSPMATEAPRLARSVPLLESLHQFLRESRAQAAETVRPRKRSITVSSVGWRYPASRSPVPIDNNPVERTLRPVAIG